MSDSTIGLCLIVKDDSEAVSLERALQQTRPHVDHAYITVTNTPNDKIQELCKKYACEYSFFQWVHDFSAARNFNIGQCKDQWFLWMDADDVIWGAEKLRQLKNNVEEKGFGAVFFNYLYHVELKKQIDLDRDIITPDNIKDVVIEHLRERLIRNDGSFLWIAPIHETLIMQREVKMIDISDIVVVHHTNGERMKKAIFRNIEILEMQLKKEKDEGKHDPRTVYYLAKAYFDLHKPEYYQKAEAYLWDYLEGPMRPSEDGKTLKRDKSLSSGWAEERAQAWEYLAEIARIYSKFDMGIKFCHSSMIEDDKFPSAYINMALHYAGKEEWDKAIRWITLSTQVGQPKTTLIINPRDLKARSLEVLYVAFLHKADVDKALDAAHRLMEIFPDNQQMKERVKFCKELQVERDLTNSFMTLAQYLYESKSEGMKLLQLLTVAPLRIMNNPVITKLRNQVMPARKWADDEICIYCGVGFEIWNPKTIQEKGSGGSEEATWYLSRELAKRGWRVTVYADPGEEAGIHDGVTFKHYFEFNIRDQFNVFVGWRNIHLYKNRINARKKLLWLHDIPNQIDYLDEKGNIAEFVKSIDTIIPLSKWHRNLLPKIPDDVMMVSTNGINLDQIKPEYEKIKRNPYRCVFTSSYDRGLEHLLKIWGDVKKAVPKAELHVYYGWNLFESFYKDNPERMAWMKKMNDLMTQDGITHHGRIGQQQIIEELFKSGVWAYPSHFGEINCISAIKAQACGVYPVTTDYAALDETVQYGVKVKGDIWDKEVRETFKESLISALQHPEVQEKKRDEMMEWARKKYSWGEVAKQWEWEINEAYRVYCYIEAIKDKVDKKVLKKNMPWIIEGYKTERPIVSIEPKEAVYELWKYMNISEELEKLDAILHALPKDLVDDEWLKHSETNLSGKHDPKVYDDSYQGESQEADANIQVHEDQLFDEKLEGVYPRLKWLRETCEKNGYKDILDVGCSDGWLSLYMAKKGYNCVGINVTKHAIDVANERAKKFNLTEKCEFVYGLAEDYNTEKRFDVIASFEILEHVADPDVYLTKLESLLKPNGIIMISTPRGTCDFGRRNKFDWREVRSRHHLRVYTVKELTEFLKKRGEIVDTIPGEIGGFDLLKVSYRPKARKL